MARFSTKKQTLLVKMTENTPNVLHTKVYGTAGASAEPWRTHQPNGCCTTDHGPDGRHGSSSPGRGTNDRHGSVSLKENERARTVKPACKPTRNVQYRSCSLAVTQLTGKPSTSSSSNTAMTLFFKRPVPPAPGSSPTTHNQNTMRAIVHANPAGRGCDRGRYLLRSICTDNLDP